MEFWLHNLLERLKNLGSEFLRYTQDKTEVPVEDFPVNLQCSVIHLQT